MPMERKVSAALITAALELKNKGGDAVTQGNMTRQKSSALLSGDKNENMRKVGSKALIGAGSKTEASLDNTAREKLTKDSKKGQDADSEAAVVITEHTLSADKIAELYAGNGAADMPTKGLPSKEQVELNRADFGENKLTPPKQTPWYVKFIGHQIGGFSLLLWGGSILCFTAYGLDSSSPDNMYLGAVLGIVVFMTGVFAWYQEFKAEQTMEGFKNLTPDDTIIRRNYNGSDSGKEFKAGERTVSFPATALVRGDLVEVTMGKKVPADIVIIVNDDMKVDNSALTGEPDALGRSTKCTHDMAWESKNVAFFGTYCVQGSCQGIVVRTGDETAVGQISKAVTQKEKPPTTMEQEIEHFIHLVSGVAVVIGVTFFIIAKLTGYSWLNAIIFMIGIIVANVPEGLLATVTIALSLTAEKMFEKNVLVKSAQTIETLGSITHVASDKTGTLTQNRMTVTHGIHSMRIIGLDTNLAENDIAQGVAVEQTNEDYVRLQRCAALCGKAFFKKEKDNSDPPYLYYDESNEAWKANGYWREDVLSRDVDGDATEGGLLKYCEPVMEHHWFRPTHVGPNERREQYVVAYREAYKQIGQVPFNSSNKYMMIMREACPAVEPAEWGFYNSGNGEPLNYRSEDGKYIVFIKGAPDKLIDACKYMRCENFDGKLYENRELNGVAMKDYFKTKREEDEREQGSLCPENPTFVPLDTVIRKETFRQQMELAALGERVLGFAEVVLTQEEFQQMMDRNIQVKGEQMDESGGSWNISHPAIGGSMQGDLWDKAVFLGMMSLQDPPRLDVPVAITECQTAGIQVVMVTGDHPVTAKAISERVNILHQECTISDWVREQEDNAGQPGYVKSKEYLNEILERFLHLPVEDQYRRRQEGDSEDIDGFWTAAQNGGTLADLEIAQDGDDHMRCKDPKAKWWMGFRLHDHRGAPITIKVLGEDGKSEVDLHDPVRGVVVAGPQIDLFNDNDWRYTLSRDKLTFARTLPAQKQQIVTMMQWYHGLMSEGALTDPGCKTDGMSNTGKLEEGIPHHKELAGDKAFLNASTTCCVAEYEKYPKLKEAGWSRFTPFLQKDEIDAGDIPFYASGPLSYIIPTKRTINTGVYLENHLFPEINEGEGGQLVTRLAQPRVVAVTGDGVNDSPALKKANCGVAMGICGADVAKEAGDMVLMDDMFCSIVEGIRQGRLIFDNLKKSIAYTLTSNIPEITPFLALICLQIPLPLETVMILCIDLGTDMLPAISLAYEQAEADIMKRTPRNRIYDKLVNNKLIGMCYGQIGMIQAAAGFACYFCVFSQYGIYLEDLMGTGFKFQSKDEMFVVGYDYDTRNEYLRQAQTSFLISIIVVQWTDVMICKTRVLSVFQQGMWNVVLNIGLLEELLLGLALVYVPFCNAAFKTTSITFAMWCYAIPFAALILAYDEVRKMLLRYERAGQTYCSQGKAGDVNTFLEQCTYY